MCSPSDDFADFRGRVATWRCRNIPSRLWNTEDGCTEVSSRKLYQLFLRDYRSWAVDFPRSTSIAIVCWFASWSRRILGRINVLLHSYDPSVEWLIDWLICAVYIMPCRGRATQHASLRCWVSVITLIHGRILEWKRVGNTDARRQDRQVNTPFVFRLYMPVCMDKVLTSDYCPVHMTRWCDRAFAWRIWLDFLPYLCYSFGHYYKSGIHAAAIASWLIDWLIGWLVHWLIEWLVHWLIDWLVHTAKS